MSPARLKTRWKLPRPDDVPLAPLYGSLISADLKSLTIEDRDKKLAESAQAFLDTQAKLKALPNPYPKLGADRVARLRAENEIFRAMVAQFATVHPTSTTPAAALRPKSVP